MAGSIASTGLDGRVAAVVVTYFPDAGLPERLNKLLEQIGRVAIVDNGSDEVSLAPLEPYGDRAGVSLLRNGANFGIAAALNQGLGLLAAEGFEWVVTLDQDSTILPGFVAGFAARLEAEPAIDDIALVGANRRDAGIETGHRWLRQKSSFPYFERVGCAQAASGVTLVITSGTLTNVAAFRHVGGFQEDLFIDLVDFEYCLRTRASGYRVIVSCASELRHEVGAKRQQSVLGVTLSPTHHGPLRKYYLFRNSVAVIGAFGRQHPHWLAYQLLALLEVVAGVVFLESGKLRKLRACAAGIVDGLRGRMGPSRRVFAPMRGDRA